MDENLRKEIGTDMEANFRNAAQKSNDDPAKKAGIELGKIEYAVLLQEQKQDLEESKQEHVEFIDTKHLELDDAKFKVEKEFKQKEFDLKNAIAEDDKKVRSEELKLKKEQLAFDKEKVRLEYEYKEKAIELEREFKQKEFESAEEQRRIENAREDAKQPKWWQVCLEYLGKGLLAAIPVAGTVWVAKIAAKTSDENRAAYEGLAWNAQKMQYGEDCIPEPGASISERNHIKP